MSPIKKKTADGLWLGSGFSNVFCFDSTASRPMGARTHAGLPHRFFQRIPRTGFGSRAAWAGNIHSCQTFSWFVPKVWHEHDKTWWNQRLLGTEFPQNLMGQNLRLLSIILGPIIFLFSFLWTNIALKWDLHFGAADDSDCFFSPTSSSKGAPGLTWYAWLVASHICFSFHL